MDRSYNDKFELNNVNNVQRFMKTVTDAIEKKYGFDAAIGFDYCESSLIREFTESQKKNILHYEYHPLGSFKIPEKIRKLTTEACTALRSLETEEHALKFLKDFGSHYPDPENVFHYGGVEMSYHSENAADTSTTTGKKESGKTSGRAKVKGLRGFFFKGKKGVHADI
ncbi:hypothetical protein QYM36_015190 [Artemia franciscana]|uniref:Uncharacterized protein n=1 Tax=Artemia franciscana TaxID=6661 RepID=A0AA88HM50_ARTSF|nr:hypothetical protein QYM36_015190 [Artemia franciscana]